MGPQKLGVLPSHSRPRQGLGPHALHWLVLEQLFQEEHMRKCVCVGGSFLPGHLGKPVSCSLRPISPGPVSDDINKQGGCQVQEKPVAFLFEGWQLWQPLARPCL